MKGLVVALVLSGSALGAQERAREPDRWFAGDKVKHFVMAGVVYGMSHASLQLMRAGERQQQIGALASASVFSIGKEVYDRRRGSVFSVRDITWDGAGIVLAGVLLRHVRR